MLHSILTFLNIISKLQCRDASCYLAGLPQLPRPRSLTNDQVIKLETKTYRSGLFIMSLLVSHSHFNFSYCHWTYWAFMNEPSYDLITLFANPSRTLNRVAESLWPIIRQQHECFLFLPTRNLSLWAKSGEKRVKAGGSKCTYPPLSVSSPYWKSKYTNNCCDGATGRC